MFDYSSRIMQLRNEKKISARKLATEINSDPSRISQIESGKSFPSAKILDDIINYFGISYSDFFNDDTNFTDVTVSKENWTKGINAKITSDELDMIMAYRKASMPEKTAINVLLEQYKSKGELEVKHA